MKREMLTSEGTAVRKGVRAWKFQQHVVLRERGCKNRLSKNLAQTLQPYIILLKDWGGAGKGRIKRLEGKILCI